MKILLILLLLVGCNDITGTSGRDLLILPDGSYRVISYKPDRVYDGYNINILNSGTKPITGMYFKINGVLLKPPLYNIQPDEIAIITIPKDIYNHGKNEIIEVKYYHGSRFYTTFLRW